MIFVNLGPAEGIVLVTTMLWVKSSNIVNDLMFVMFLPVMTTFWSKIWGPVPVMLGKDPLGSLYLNKTNLQHDPPTNAGAAWLGINSQTSSMLRMWIWLPTRLVTPVPWVSPAITLAKLQVALMLGPVPKAGTQLPTALNVWVRHLISAFLTVTAREIRATEARKVVGRL